MQREEYDAVFKAKEALEAVKGLKTINEVAAPNMAINSRRQLCQVALASLSVYGTIQPVGWLEFEIAARPI